ncbi:MAG TPA: CDP-alcohol phosphatidyltransferase family protein [Thermoanaerobaculia bacterium]|jgi:cardiolipin synthase|nr:CDP-alcohol phosphatidyltransferase family protein [Thermoanaerobaculia bacterium]
MINVPNALTIFRIFLVPFFLVASMRSMWTLAFGLFVTAAVTDILDGLIARRFNQRSRLGAILDPAADKTMMVCGYFFYTVTDKLPVVALPVWLTFVVFVRDFLIICFAYLMYTRVQVKRFPPSWAGKASTVLQAGTLAALIAVNGFLPRLLPFAEILFHVALLVTLYSSWDYMRRGRRLLEEGLSRAA